MTTRAVMVRGLAVAGGVTVAVAAVLAGLTWRRYGRPSPPDEDEYDELLEQFMPTYDIVERHHVAVTAPCTVTLDAARTMDLFGNVVVRTIVAARARLLGAVPEERPDNRELEAAARAMGWGVLADVPGREIVFGAVTRPWEANVVFHALAPDAFTAFADPDYVKIVWTLRADPVGPGRSIFRTETRAVATDARARARFRRYWTMLSPGIIVIRRAALRPLKREAERRAAVQRRGPAV